MLPMKMIILTKITNVIIKTFEDDNRPKYRLGNYKLTMLFKDFIK